MPFSVSEQDITGRRRRPAVTPQARGGFTRPTRQDANAAMMEQYRGQHGSAEIPHASAVQQPLSMAMLREAAQATDAADHSKVVADVDQQRSEGRMDTIGRAHADEMNKTALSMSPWTAFTQALKNRGADSLATGAARGMEGPGFYDTQNPSIAGTQTIGQQQRMAQLKDFYANHNAANRSR